MSEINKQRLPTPADLIILDWLQKGQSINNAEAITRFGNACLRDCIWRLGNAGYLVNRDWVHYENGKGQKKKYMRYFMTTPEIIPSGAKTDNEALAYKKGEMSATDYAQKLIKTPQPELFDITHY